MDFRFIALSILALVALLACEIEPAASEAPPPAPASIDAIVDHAREHQITDAGALLEALPADMRDNAVLLAESASPHRADLHHPRIVAFSPGARLIVAVSTDPEDPRRDVVHMAELAGSAWRFRALDLGSDTFADDDGACTACHGAPARPIWGSYPSWPGAFADELGTLSDEEREAIAAMVADPEHRVAKLALDVDLEGGTMRLADRFYAAPNPVLSAELGAATAEVLATRLMASARYDELRDALLLTEACWPTEGSVEEAFAALAEALEADEAALRVALYEALGLDPAVDLDLERVSGDARDDALWHTGSATLHGLVAFLLLDEAIGADPIVARLFAPVDPHRRRMIRDWWELDGAARRALFRAGNEVLLDPQEIFEAALGDAHDPRRQRLCEHLARQILGDGADREDAGPAPGHDRDFAIDDGAELDSN